ncbi:MAG: hypothetical protein NTZ05_13870 [Chloroflexi bacterium]|nr:hypothetical protein [Chloroflexota bacterium]
MACYRCGSWCAPSDNYCRRCGDKMQMVLPAVPESSSRALAPITVPPAIIKGVAAIVLGKAVEWAVRRAAGKLAGEAGNAARGLLTSRRSPAPSAKAPLEQLPPGNVVTEMLVFLRQVRSGDDGPSSPPARRR